MVDSTPNLCDANAALSLLSYILANSILATLWTLGQVKSSAEAEIHG